MTILQGASGTRKRAVEPRHDPAQTETTGQALSDKRKTEKVLLESTCLCHISHEVFILVPRRCFVQRHAEVFVLREEVLVVEVEAIQRHHHSIRLRVQPKHLHPFLVARPRKVQSALVFHRGTREQRRGDITGRNRGGGVQCNIT